MKGFEKEVWILELLLGVKHLKSSIHMHTNIHV